MARARGVRHRAFLNGSEVTPFFAASTDEGWIDVPDPSGEDGRRRLKGRVETQPVSEESI